MYLIEKLVYLSQTEPFSVNGTISRELLKRSAGLTYGSVSSFCRETGISRASLHRFFSACGFQSWKEFLGSLKDDCRRNDASSYYPSEFSVPEETDISLKKLVDSCSRAEKIAFFGDLHLLPYLQPFFQTLQKSGKSVLVLNHWDQEENQSILKLLHENDLLILFELNMRTDLFAEFSANRPYMIDLKDLEKSGFHKIHLCMKKQKQSYGFEQAAYSGSPIESAAELVSQAEKLACLFLPEKPGSK